jgi:diacylglycerol kinase (ATP)
VQVHGALAATRYQIEATEVGSDARARVVAVEPLLLITHGESGASDDLGPALEVLRGHTSVEVCATSNPGELDGVLHRAGSRPIVVAGGDGSLHAVVATLHRRNDLSGKVLGLLPLGTGNDFARALDVPLDPVEAAKALVSSTPRPLDLIVDELGEVVVHHVHVGASALASKRGASWKERLGPYGIGIIGYPIGAALSALRPPTVRLHVEVDGRVVADVDRQVLMVAVGNGSSVGGGTELTPDADPEDGKADILVSFATTPRARLGYAVDLVRRRHPERADTLYLRGSQVSVSGQEFWLSADGEVSGPEGRRTWHVERAAYSMLLP